VEITVDELLVAEEVPFTTITNKKSKGKEKPSPSTNTPVSSQNMPLPATVISRAPSSPQPTKMAIVKPISTKIATTL